MTNGKAISPSVYLVADHLDAVLAIGEDLLNLPSPDPVECIGELMPMQRNLAGQRQYLEWVRALETRLVASILRAREHAEQVRRYDSRVKTITDLLVAGTHAVADAAADMADTMAYDFNTGGDSLAYLRSRGVVDADAVSLTRGMVLQTTEHFRIAGVIELGALAPTAILRPTNG